MNWQPSPKTTDAVIDVDDQSDASCNAYYGGRLIAESVERSKRPLIAAAPDLRDALTALLSEVDKRCGGRAQGYGAFIDAVDLSRAALEKAKVQS